MVTEAPWENGRRSHINWNRSALLGSSACFRLTHSSTYASEAQSWWSRRCMVAPTRYQNASLSDRPQLCGPLLQINARVHLTVHRRRGGRVGCGRDSVDPLPSLRQDCERKRRAHTLLALRPNPTAELHELPIQGKP